MRRTGSSKKDGSSVDSPSVGWGSPPEPRLYSVSASDKRPLLDFITGALRLAGCRILFESPANQAPFRVTFETAEGERLGIVVYAFLANQKLTKNRPADEHRFQVKYGSKDGALHELWQDPYHLYTTLFVGINPDQGLFVGADPVLHSPTKLFISVEFKQVHADAILENGWHVWERDRRMGDDTPIEVLVGGRKEAFLRFVRFERASLREAPGHRQLLAERLERIVIPNKVEIGDAFLSFPPPGRLHDLAKEFQLSEREILNLIEEAPRLKMAVRGWVAEEHLFRMLKEEREVEDCKRLHEDGKPDIALRFRGTPLTVECKNVLRKTTQDGLARVDFQRTRSSLGDPSSRYYSPKDFEIIAACLHAVTEKWEFRYALTRNMEQHKRFAAKLSNNVRVETTWPASARPVLIEAVR